MNELLDKLINLKVDSSDLNIRTDITNRIMFYMLEKDEGNTSMASLKLFTKAQDEAKELISKYEQKEAA